MSPQPPLVLHIYKSTMWNAIEIEEENKGKIGHTCKFIDKNKFHKQIIYLPGTSSSFLNSLNMKSQHLKAKISLVCFPVCYQININERRLKLTWRMALRTVICNFDGSTSASPANKYLDFRVRNTQKGLIESEQEVSIFFFFFLLRISST